jgi:signal transduction histidine kinase/ActR/RegA family two-component response regulator
LFDELNRYLDNISNIKLKQSDKTDKLLAHQLSIAHYSYITLILISLVVSFIISSFITHSLRKPLVKLVDASNEVAKGNFNTEIKVLGNDEISSLARAFNDMVNKLQESQLAITTARDVAEHANHAKTVFLTRMSHELRTPLNAILGFAQILDFDSPENTNLDKNAYVKNILKSGWHLLDLVDELLDFSRIETNTILVKSKKNEILSLVHECVDIVRPIANEKKTLIFDNVSDSYNYYAKVDAIHFKQVILNLLSNAIKYNSENGKVTVSCDFIEDHFVKILVCDEGEGLTKKQEVEVFDAFQRLDADEKAIGGIGLGLNIAKNLVELMGGEIGVESQKGKGSCFWIEFPILNVIEKSEDHSNVILSDKNMIRSTDVHKVLYIEDDPFNSELVRELFTIMRPEIILLEAETAELGLKIAKEYEPDLILMDLNLPGMSGQEAFDELKKDTKTENIPVVAISADAVKESINICKKQGFKEYITKPIDVDYFTDVVDGILEDIK